VHRSKGGHFSTFGVCDPRKGGYSCCHPEWAFTFPYAFGGCVRRTSWNRGAPPGWRATGSEGSPPGCTGPIGRKKQHDVLLTEVSWKVHPRSGSRVEMIEMGVIGERPLGHVTSAPLFSSSNRVAQKFHHVNAHHHTTEHALVKNICILLVATEAIKKRRGSHAIHPHIHLQRIMSVVVVVPYSPSSKHPTLSSASTGPPSCEPY